MALRPVAFNEDMATISFSEAAPKDAGKVHFTFGVQDFDLEPGGTLDSEDPTLVGSAALHPWLTVTYPQATHDESEKQAEMVANSTDPHVNPRADHLRAEADPEVVKAADERAQAIRDIAQPNTQAQVEPEAHEEAAPTETVESSPVTVNAPADTSTQEHTP